MNKQVRIVPKRREPLDLERLAEALLDLALELEAAEQRERPNPAAERPRQTGVSKPKRGRAA